MRFDKSASKHKQKEIEEQQVGSEEPQEEVEPAELENVVEKEVKVDTKPNEGEVVSKEVYETEKGKTVLEYKKSKEKGYCELRERNKSVYGIKYAAGKGVDIAKKAKIAIMDWCKILPRKSSTERKDKEDLI